MLVSDSVGNPHYSNLKLPTQPFSQSPGADPGFGKGGFNSVPNSDTGGATNNDFWNHRQGSAEKFKKGFH